MPNGYLYQKLEKLLREYKTRERVALKELAEELARRFRLTRKDVIQIMKELEQERKAFIKRKRKIFVELKQGKTRLLILIKRWLHGMG